MAYKEWRVQEQSKEDQRYIVQIDWNDSEGHPGTCFYGPFTKEDAEDFNQHFDEDDTEMGDTMVIFLNAAAIEEIDD